jgi:hypothetical protein
MNASALVITIRNTDAVTDAPATVTDSHHQSQTKRLAPDRLGAGQGPFALVVAGVEFEPT